MTRAEMNTPTLIGELAGGLAPTPLLQLLTYGTLMEGARNHDAFCSGFVSVEAATIAGRLRWLSSAVPIVDVPPESVIAEGTANAIEDAVLQAEVTARLARSAAQPLQGSIAGQPFVEGEVFVFDDPVVRLPRIDRFEGFRPGLPSLYRRVLVPLLSEPGRVVWVYASPAKVATDRG